MIKTILVPTDFSSNAKVALNYAIKLAKIETSKIILFHAYHLAYYSGDVTPELIPELNLVAEKELDKRLLSLSKKVEKEHGIICEAFMQQGLFVDIIEQVIKKKKVSLIVMGTKGKTGLEEILMGSNTTKVIQEVSCPVIAVPEKGKHTAIKKIVYATDYHSMDVASLEFLIDIAKDSKAHIDVVHFVDENASKEKVDHLSVFEKKMGKRNNFKNISYKLLDGSEIDQTFDKYIKKESINLIGVSTKHKTFLERVFGKRSVTKKLLKHSNIPLIAFHHKK